MHLLLLLGTVALANPAAGGGGKEDPAHQELRALRDDAVDAINQNDIERLLRHVHPNAVLIAPNIDPGAEVVRGRDGVRAYYDKMLTGPHRRADRLTVEVTVDELAILYGGDTAIAWGSSIDRYQMRDGSPFVLESRWSSTLVKQDGKWLIAEFHVSTNPFDNAILHLIVRRTLWLVGGGVAVAALLVGLLLGRLFRAKAQGGPDTTGTSA